MKTSQKNATRTKYYIMSPEEKNNNNNINRIKRSLMLIENLHTKHSKLIEIKKAKFIYVKDE